MYIDPALLIGSVENQPNSFTAGQPLPWQLINGTIYLFANAGDTLALHSHPVGQTHTVGVTQGSLLYHTVNADGTTTDQTLNVGDLILIPPNLEHSLTAVSSPVNTSGATVTDPTTLAAICVNVRMASVMPADIKAGLQSLNDKAQALLTTIQGISALTV